MVIGVGDYQMGVGEYVSVNSLVPWIRKGWQEYLYCKRTGW
jgi:hypothetical protein